MQTLADTFRPIKIEDVIGQSHLLGKGSILYNLIKNKKLFSMILYGKPGIGKTTIANVIVNNIDIKYLFLNAVINNKKDFDIAIESAKMYGELVLVIDEIHRMNKDKQDILLPYIESGLIILIGLTTANPYHKINPAIRSRCQIFELHELTTDDIIKGLKKASVLLPEIIIKKDSLKYIATLSGFDFRNALNLLEITYYAFDNHIISIDNIKKINSKPIFFHDSSDDGHYDVLSAFQKSIRGSDVNASLHYLSRLLIAEDLDSIFRRLSVIAYEDIGLANPGIGPKLNAAIQATERVGLPEGRIPLAEIVIEMALSPKSNSVIISLDKAIKDIECGNVGTVPNHIKTSSKDYLYPHNYKNNYIEQQYLPDLLKDKTYYIPGKNIYEQNLINIHNKMKK